MNRTRAALAVVSVLIAVSLESTSRAVVASGPTLEPAITSMAGKVLTVNGPVDPAAIGTTLMHEHIFIDFNLPDDDPQRWRAAGRVPPVGATAAGIYNAPLTMDKLAFVLLGSPSRDNWYLTDERIAISEMLEYKQRGGNTIVDVTSIGLKRDPMALRRVANATGVNVVMGASWYRKSWHPADMDSRTVESLTGEIVRDVTVGVDDTGIRSGIIGEVGTQGNPLTANEIKVIKASGRASRLTGAAVTLHTSAGLHEQAGILDLLAAEGADLKRVVVGHSNPIANDAAFMKQLADRGVFIQFDLLGQNPTVRSRVTDTDVAKAIVDLVKAGYLERILLSQDVCTKIQLKAYGGTGFSFILEQFVPYLTRLGLTDQQIETITISNPKRVLTFVLPAPAKSTA